MSTPFYEHLVASGIPASWTILRVGWQPEKYVDDPRDAALWFRLLTGADIIAYALDRYLLAAAGGVTLPFDSDEHAVVSRLAFADASNFTSLDEGLKQAAPFSTRLQIEFAFLVWRWTRVSLTVAEYKREVARRAAAGVVWRPMWEDPAHDVVCSLPLLLNLLDYHTLLPSRLGQQTGTSMSDLLAHLEQCESFLETERRDLIAAAASQS